MDGIFISYRRDDSAGYAGRLYDRLVAHFGSNRVFMDVEGIELGVDFVDAIETAVGSCKVLIAMIGDEWLSATDAAGRKRLDDPNDFIRLETGSALKRGIRVVPVLVGGAAMPLASDLPDDLKALTRRQAIEVNHKQWEASTGELIRALESILTGTPARTGGGADEQVSRRDAVAAPRTTGKGDGGNGGKGRWVIPAVIAAAMAVGAGLWALIGDGGDDARPVAAPGGTVVAEAKPEQPAAAAAAVGPAVNEPQKEDKEQTPAPPAAPAEAPQPKPAPVQAAAAKPVIDDLSAEVSAGRARLCYRVTQATSLTLSPRPGELRRLEENCVLVRVEQETAFTLTARNGDQVARRTVTVVPVPQAAPPAGPPVAVAPSPAATSPTRPVEGVASTDLPVKGESWTYRSSGKWATSPKRRLELTVQAVAAGLVTEALAVVEGGSGEEVRRGRSDRADFVAWPTIGPEFSPYLGVFAKLAQRPAFSDIATPDLDPQWREWYSKAEVVGEESVNVPAGSFKAFKVEVWSSRRQTGSNATAAVEPVRVHYLVWYSPAVKRYVRMQRRVLSVTNAELEKDVFELVAHRQP